MRKTWLTCIFFPRRLLSRQHNLRIKKERNLSLICVCLLKLRLEIWFQSVNAYCWEGALSEYFPKFEVLRLLLLGLRCLCCLRRLAAGCTIDTGLRGRALHAGAMATACAWDSKWRAGVRVIPYHWWMRAWTDDNTGLNGHDIIL